MSRLRRTLVGPTTVIGFPHGAHVSQIKEREAVVAVDQGAVDLDVVLNIGALRAGDLGYVRDELAGLVNAVAPTPNVGVKAAGGVRTLDSMLAMLAAGACRVGATATATIGGEWRARGPEAVAALVSAAAGGRK